MKLTPAALAREGDELKHCVGTYVEAVRSGKSHILALRVGRDRSTVEISKDGYILHFGPGNTPPSPVMVRLLARLAAKNGWR